MTLSKEHSPFSISPATAVALAVSNARNLLAAGLIADADEVLRAIERAAEARAMQKAVLFDQEAE